MNKKIKGMAAMAAMLLTTSPQAIAQYEFTEIVVPGQNSLQAFGINDPGTVVGGSSDPVDVSFSYDSKTGTVSIIDPADGFDSISTLGINDSGELAGNVDAGGVTQGFMRDKQGNDTVFSHPNAVTQTSARGINNRGILTGIRDDENGFLQGFIYDSKTDSITDIDLGDAFFVIAHGINSRGDIVGDARYLNADPCGNASGVVRYGWIRDKHGAINFFQINSAPTAARGINDAGEITGFFINPGTGLFTGFVVDAPTTDCAIINVPAENFIELPGSQGTFPEGITNSGDIAGIYLDDSFNLQGFFATSQ